MEQRRLGASSLVCSPLGFGSWEMSNAYGSIDIGEFSAAANWAIDNGITLFDTAEGYGHGYAERVLGKALGPRRKEIVLVTKVIHIFDENGKDIGRDAGRANVLSATEGCLDRLGTDWVDLLLIHWPDHKTPAEETIGALEQLKQAGKIREYGVSNYNVPMMEECLKYGRIATNQVGYHMFDRRMESKVLPYCGEKQIGFMAYGTLGYGLLTGAFTPETSFGQNDWRSRGKAFRLPLFEREDFLKELKVVERLKALAGQHDKTVAQLAIAWVLSHPAVSVALVGARKPSEIAENIRAVGWKLTPEIKAEIDQIFAEEQVSTYIDAEQAT